MYSFAATIATPASRRLLSLSRLTALISTLSSTKAPTASSIAMAMLRVNRWNLMSRRNLRSRNHLETRLSEMLVLRTTTSGAVRWTAHRLFSALARRDLACGRLMGSVRAVLQRAIYPRTATVAWVLVLAVEHGCEVWWSISLGRNGDRLDRDRNTGDLKRLAILSCYARLA